MYCIMSHVSGYLAGHGGEKQQTYSFAARHFTWQANSRGKVLTESLTLNMGYSRPVYSYYHVMFVTAYAAKLHTRRL